MDNLNWKPDTTVVDVVKWVFRDEKNPDAIVDQYERFFATERVSTLGDVCESTKVEFECRLRAVTPALNGISLVVNKLGLKLPSLDCESNQWRTSGTRA